MCAAAARSSPSTRDGECYARKFCPEESFVPNRRIGTIAVFLCFVISRLLLVSSHQRGSTLADVNVRYATEAQRAAAQHVSFYKLHEEARRTEAPLSLPQERAIEYPPLAILWM